MAVPFIVPQSGGAISISSNAGGFNQNNDPNQYYLNSGGGSQQSNTYTFTFADGGSFYLTEFNQFGPGPIGSYKSSSSINVVAYLVLRMMAMAALLMLLEAAISLLLMTSMMQQIILS